METGKIKLIVAGLIILIGLGTFFTLSNVFAVEEPSYTERHKQLDQDLQAKFDSWVATNGAKDFCMPKAKLLSDEMEIRANLGDDTTQLEARRNKVMNECKETVKFVLF